VILFLGALFFLGVLRRLGWLKPAGVTRLGSGRGWLLLLPLLIYSPAINVLAFFPNLNLSLPEARVMGALGFEHLGIALLEELAFRGLILYGLIRVWGRSRRGVVGAVVTSALLFSVAHLANLLMGKPASLVLLQVVSALLVGFYLTVVVLYTRSIWPAVLFHGLGNFAVNLLTLTHPNFQETVASWVLLLGLRAPLYLLALYLLRYLPLYPTAAPAETVDLTPGRLATD
jgi:membrane protease YdiL (CAAX protease family)